MMRKGKEDLMRKKVIKKAAQGGHGSPKSGTRDIGLCATPLSNGGSGAAQSMTKVMQMHD